MPGQGHHQAERGFYESFAEAAIALAAAGCATGPSRILAYYPHIKRNPYQQMLYSRAFAHGFAALSVPGPRQLLDVPQTFAPVLHLHWLHNVCAKAKNAAEARTATGWFLDHIKAVKDTGAPILWTVHNLMSHDLRFPDEEAEFRGAVAGLADHIHVMNQRTVDLARPWYDIDEAKVFHVPHPSYNGVYANYMERSAARLALGYGSDDCVFLLFGGLGEQKGTRAFLNHMDGLQRKMAGRAKVLVAGAPGSAAHLARIGDIAAARAEVRIDPAHVPGQLIQQYFNAADVVVCPYAAGLNSGVIAMAATFGKPVVAPTVMLDEGEGRQPAAFGFKMGDIADCHRACKDAAEAQHDASALAGWAVARAPEAVSGVFFQALRERL